jgi:hypothetical protein
VITKIEPYWKAVVGFVGPGVVILLNAITAGSDGGTAITQSEWLTALFTAIATSAGVYVIPNKDKKGKHQRESVQPPVKGRRRT